MSYWICDKDQNCIDCPKHYPEETCEHYIEVEPVKHIHTEADRIRAMTDEELAALLCDHACMVCPIEGCEGRMEEGQKKCKQRWLNWLKQEVTDV